MTNIEHFENIEAKIMKKQRKEAEEELRKNPPIKNKE